MRGWGAEIMGRLWKAAGDTRLTFFSLAATAILFFVGFLYADANFELFASLNETRLQDWAASHLLENLSLTWWLPVLMLALLALGVNTVACTWQRLAILLPTRKGRPFAAFFRDLTPSIIHALFAVVMVGHLMTITLGEWDRVPLREGVVVSVGGEDLVVASVENRFFPPVEGQPRRIAQTMVGLEAASGEIFELGHGEPLSYAGSHLILDRKKKRKVDEEEPPEDCNEDEDYRVKEKGPPPGPSLLVVTDPGVRVIFPAFGLILVLMGWFYLGKR